MIEMTKQMTKYREPEKDVYDALINQFEKVWTAKQSIKYSVN